VAVGRRLPDDGSRGRVTNAGGQGWYR
jgi:hypothetical protein